MKICTKCEEQKSLDCFGLTSGKWIRKLSICKKCVAKRSLDHYYANKEEVNKKRKKYYEDHKQESLKKAKIRYFENHSEIRKKANEQNRTPERRKKSNERVKEWNKKNPNKLRERIRNYKKNNPEKSKAHQYVLWAVKLGVIKKPNICEQCKKQTRLEGHHKDYSKRLEVEWLCKLCHEERHRKEDLCHQSLKLIIQ